MRHAVTLLFSSESSLSRLQKRARTGNKVGAFSNGGADCLKWLMEAGKALTSVLGPVVCICAANTAVGDARREPASLGSACVGVWTCGPSTGGTGPAAEPHVRPNHKQHHALKTCPVGLSSHCTQQITSPSYIFQGRSATCTTHHAPQTTKLDGRIGTSVAA